MRSAVSLAVTVIMASAVPSPVASQSQPSSDLEAFGALVIGEWVADGARHVFSWGVGRRLVHASSYFAEDDGWRLVSEGIWYADAVDGSIRSVQLAIDMPVERFEYRSRVRGNRIEHELQTFGADPGRFVEIWSFGEAGYDWWLESPDEPGKRLMGGSFRRSAPGGEGPSVAGRDSRARVSGDGGIDLIETFRIPHPDFHDGPPRR